MTKQFDFVGRRKVFIGMGRRTGRLWELYDKEPTLPTEKRVKGCHPPM